MIDKPPTSADHIEAMKHLDPEGALSGLDMTDSEGMAIRAAIDLWGMTLNPPLHGNAAIRAALKDWLIGLGLWAHVEPTKAERPNKTARSVSHGRLMLTCQSVA